MNPLTNGFYWEDIDAARSKMPIWGVQDMRLMEGEAQCTGTRRKEEGL